MMNPLKILMCLKCWTILPTKDEIPEDNQSENRECHYGKKDCFLNNRPFGPERFELFDNSFKKFVHFSPPKKETYMMQLLWKIPIITPYEDTT